MYFRIKRKSLFNVSGFYSTSFNLYLHVILICFSWSFFLPSSAASCPRTTTQRVQPTAQFARTVSQSHPQRAAHAAKRHLSGVLSTAAQRWWLFFHFSQLSISPLSSQLWYLPKLSCQLGALQSIPTPRYAKAIHVPDPGKPAKLLFDSAVALM